MSDTNEMRALICHQCGAPMKSRSKCNYCGTSYEYVGPPVPEHSLSAEIWYENGNSTCAPMRFSQFITTDRSYSTTPPGYWDNGVWVPVTYGVGAYAY